VGNYVIITINKTILGDEIHMPKKIYKGENAFLFWEKNDRTIVFNLKIQRKKPS